MRLTVRSLLWSVLSVSLALPAFSSPTGLPAPSVVTTPPDSLEAGSPVTTVIIVRHAEKDTIRNDPGLTGAGIRRSELLREMLAGSHVSAVFATQYRRTRETVRPLSEMAGIPTVIVGVDNDIRGHARALVDSIDARGAGTFLVASHSNVIPAILEALRVPGSYSIPDDEYDGFYIVTRTGEEPGRLLLLRYGGRGSGRDAGAGSGRN